VKGIDGLGEESVRMCDDQSPRGTEGPEILETA
jgi:hypothetical protein